MAGIANESLLLLGAEPRRRKHIPPGRFRHAIQQLAIGRITLPAAHPPAGNLIRPEVEEPGKRRLPHVGQEQRPQPKHVDELIDRAHVRFHQAAVGPVGHDQRRVIEDDADLQAGGIDRLHLVVPGRQMAQREQLRPVGPAVIHAKLILERSITNGHEDTLAAAHLQANAVQQLCVHRRRRQRPDAILPREHGVQNCSGHLLHAVRRQGAKRLTGRRLHQSAANALQDLSAKSLRRQKKPWHGA